MPFLQTLTLAAPGTEFPLSLPVFARFEALAFTAPVTFLVGDNGCGKSTLLEIIAAGLKLPSITQRPVAEHPLMAPARAAAKAFRFARGAGGMRRGQRRGGFFFRADDVVGFLQAVERNAREHRQLAERFAQELPPGWGQDRAVGMARAQAGALAERYGEDEETLAAVTEAMLAEPVNALAALVEREGTEEEAVVAYIGTRLLARTRSVVEANAPVMGRIWDQVAGPARDEAEEQAADDAAQMIAEDMMAYEGPGPAGRKSGVPMLDWVHKVASRGTLPGRGRPARPRDYLNRIRGLLLRTGA